MSIGIFLGPVTLFPPLAQAIVDWSGVDTDPHQSNLSLWFSILESREDSPVLCDGGGPCMLDLGAFGAMLSTTLRWSICGRECSLLREEWQSRGVQTPV